MYIGQRYPAGRSGGAKKEREAQKKLTKQHDKVYLEEEHGRH